MSAPRGQQERGVAHPGRADEVSGRSADVIDRVVVTLKYYYVEWKYFQ